MEFRIAQIVPGSGVIHFTREGSADWRAPVVGYAVVERLDDGVAIGQTIDPVIIADNKVQTLDDYLCGFIENRDDAPPLPSAFLYGAAGAA